MFSNSSNRLKLKQNLKTKHGTLRMAARVLEISPFRLSSIINGWLVPTEDEVKKIRQTLKNSATKNKEFGDE